jgi:Tfp pilus assembly protein PilF
MSTPRQLLIVLFAVLALGQLAGSPGRSQDTDRAQRRAQVGALLAGAQEYLHAEKYDSARTALTAVLEIEPANQDAYYYLAASYLAQDDEPQAREMLAEGMAKAPMSSRLKFFMARLHIGAGEYDEAEQLIVAVLRFKPNNPEALYLRGMSRLAAADTNAALADWEAALDKTVNGGKHR